MLISQIPEDSPVVPKRGHIHIIEGSCDLRTGLWCLGPTPQDVWFCRGSGRSWAGEKSLTLVGACFSVGLWLYCWLIKVLHTYIYIHTHTRIYIYIYIRRKMQLLEWSAEICHVQPLDSIGDAVPMRKQRHLKEKVSFAHRCWTSIFRTCVLKHG